MIEPLQLIYPVLSPHKNVLVSALLSSDDQKTESIFQLLKDHNIITDYSMRSSDHKRIMENPNLFGDPNPLLDNLLQPGDTPDLSAGEHDTSWNECDLSILRYFGIGGNGPKLIEILREEKKLHKPWTYEQIKYSHEKMVKNNLIIKIYLVNPFPPSQCVHFLLFLKCEDVHLTQRILCNFAQGERIYKDYSLYGEWGMIICFSHHGFLMNLMSKLDRTEEISEKEVYQLRAFPPLKYWMSRPPEFRYFDFEKQTLHYPYDMYVERIKEKIESEPEP